MDLKLAITQGPRAGETLEYPPRCTVRVGRVLRGNDLPIKDLGVSSKHLSIGHESGKWVLRDLGSSNGTFLNGELVESSAAVEIRDGDIIKIGECTSISVGIGDCDGSRLRRNPRRGGRALKEGDEKCGLVVENSEEVVGNPPRVRPRRARVLNVSCSVLGNIPENSDLEGGEMEIGAGGNAVKQRPVRKASTTRTRSSKNEESIVSGSVIAEIPGISDLEGREVEVVSRQMRASTRRGRKLPPKKPPQCVSIDISEDSGDNIRVDATNGESGKTSNLGEQDRIETDGNKEGNEDDCRIVESADEAEKDRGRSSKENEVGKDFDLEKMTLGQWFDFLEVNLPKQIIEATEEMIKDMRLRAKRVHDYLVQLKNEKAKAPLG